MADAPNTQQPTAEPAWMIDPSGQVVTVPAASVPDALAAKYAMAGPDQIKAAQDTEARHAKYGGLKGELEAGGLGVARGLSFGLSDVGLDKTGLVSKETQQALSQENPVSSVVGEGAGIALPMLATGGGAAAAEGAAKATGILASAKAGLRAMAKVTAPGLAAEAGDAARAGVALHGVDWAEIAAKAAADKGFTYDPLARQFVKEGIAFAPSKATEAAMGEHVSAEQIQQYARDHLHEILKGEKLGGWHATEGKLVGQDVADMSEVTASQNAALKGAHNASQDGVFNLGTGQYTPTPASPGAEIMRAVAPMVNTPLNAIARKALAQGAGSAVEMGAYALGHTVSEAALGDHDLTAESLLSQVGVAGLLGLGGGVALSGIWNLSKNMLASTHLKEKVAEWLADTEVTQGVKSLRPSGAVAKRILGASDINEAVPYWKEEGLVGALTQPKTALANAVDHATEMGQKVDSALSVADSMMNPDEAPKIASIVGKARMRIVSKLADDPTMASEAKRANGLLDAYKEKFSDGMTLGDLREMRQQVDSEINWARFPLNGARPGYETAMVGFRNQLNDTIVDTMKGIKGLPGDVLDQYQTSMKGLRYALLLKDAAESGVQRAEGRAGLSVSDMFAGLLGGGAEGARGVAAGLAEDVAERAPGALGAVASGVGALGAAGNMAAGAAAGIAVKRIADKYGAGLASAAAGVARNLMDGAGGSLVDGAVPLVARMETETHTAGYAGRLLREAGEDGALRSLVDKSAGALAGDRQGFAQMLPEHVGQVQPQTDVVRGATAIGNDPEKAATLAALERSLSSVRTRIDTQAGNAVRGTVQGHGEPASAVQAPMDQGTFERRVNALRQIIANPEAMQKVLVKQGSDWGEHAPNTALATHAATVRAAQYLSNVAPTRVPAGPLAQQPEVSHSDRASFSRAWNAVSDPVSILKQATGGTLTRDAVQAVQAVYPKLYAQIQTAVLDKITNHRGVIPYRQRQMTSILLGQDMDGTMNGSFAMRNQATYQKPQQQPPMPKPSRDGNSKITLAQRSMTETQRRSSGVGEES